MRVALRALHSAAQGARRSWVIEGSTPPRSRARGSRPRSPAPARRSATGRSGRGARPGGRTGVAGALRRPGRGRCAVGVVHVDVGQVVALDDLRLPAAAVNEGEAARLHQLRRRHAEMFVDHPVQPVAAAAHEVEQRRAIEAVPNDNPRPGCGQGADATLVGGRPGPPTIASVSLPGHTPLLDRLRTGVAGEAALRWTDVWTAVARPLIAPSS